MTVTIKKKKSPRAPSLALGDAIERALRVYDEEGGRHPAPLDTVAQHLGYKNAKSGAALTAIASLRYYGLFERPMDGHLAATQDLESYKFAPSDKLRKELAVKWLQTPPIFSELLEKFEAGLPSDGTLKHTLIQMGFTPSGADICMGAFRKSVEFSGYYETPVKSEEEVFDEGENSAVSTDAPASSPQEQSTSASTAVALTSSDVDRIPVRLPGGRRAWIEIPSPFYSTDRERLKAQIDLLLADDEEEEMGE